MRSGGAVTTVVALLTTAALGTVAGCSSDPGADAAAPGAGTTTSAAVATPPARTPQRRPSSAPSAPSATPSRNPLAEAVEGLDPIDEQVVGADISWPQCPPGMGIPQKRSSGQPLPVEAARFVVIGLTNGPGFHPNPCLPDQVAFVRERGLMAAAYSVVSYPEPADLMRYRTQGPYDAASSAGALANTGYAQARFNLRSMRAAGLQSPIIWIDVEPVPDFAWSSDTSANAAVVRGMARGYTEAGFAIGVYSTPYLWQEVVGGLSLGVPEWRAAGQTSIEEALVRCGPDWVIQGGVAALGQWVQEGRDMNVTCPGTALDLSRWFHRY